MEDVENAHRGGPQGPAPLTAPSCAPCGDPRAGAGPWGVDALSSVPRAPLATVGAEVAPSHPNAPPQIAFPASASTPRPATPPGTWPPGEEGAERTLVDNNSSGALAVKDSLLCEDPAQGAAPGTSLTRLSPTGTDGLATHTNPGLACAIVAEPPLLAHIAPGPVHPAPAPQQPHQEACVAAAGHQGPTGQTSWSQGAAGTTGTVTNPAEQIGLWSAAPGTFGAGWHPAASTPFTHAPAAAPATSSTGPLWYSVPASMFQGMMAAAASLAASGAVPTTTPALGNSNRQFGGSGCNQQWPPPSHHVPGAPPTASTPADTSLPSHLLALAAAAAASNAQSSGRPDAGGAALPPGQPPAFNSYRRYSTGPVPQPATQAASHAPVGAHPTTSAYLPFPEGVALSETAGGPPASFGNGSMGCMGRKRVSGDAFPEGAAADGSNLKSAGGPPPTVWHAAPSYFQGPFAVTSVPSGGASHNGEPQASARPASGNGCGTGHPTPFLPFAGSGHGPTGTVECWPQETKRARGDDATAAGSRRLSLPSTWGAGASGPAPAADRGAAATGGVCQWRGSEGQVGQPNGYEGATVAASVAPAGPSPGDAVEDGQGEGGAIKLLTCGFCPFSARTSTQIRVHERIHTGDKPYKCAFCDYRSAQVGNTRIHERRHTGVKPYPCPRCPFAAVTSSATYAHMKSMHPGATDEVKPALPAARGRRASTGGALPLAVAAPPSAPVGHQAAGPGAPGQGQAPQAIGSTGSAATLVASAAVAGPCAASAGQPAAHRESFLLVGTACPPPVGHHDVVSEVHQVAVSLSLPALPLQQPGPGQPQHEPAAGSVGATGTSESAVFRVPSSSGSPATASAITHWHQAPLVPAGQPQAQAACAFDPDSSSGQLLGLDVPVVHVAAMDPTQYFHSESEQHPHVPVAES